MQALFEHAEAHRFEEIPHDEHEQMEKGQGRLLSRRCSAIALWDLSGLWQEVQQEWDGVCSLVRIHSERRLGQRVTQQTRYSLSSLPAHAKRLLRAVRAHGGIENRGHWVLDVAFREEACRVRKENAPQNLATLGHIALNLLRQEKTAKGGVKNRRLQAGWNHLYLEKLLTG